MMNLIFLMDLILLQTAKTTLSLSLKKTNFSCKSSCTNLREQNQKENCFQSRNKIQIRITISRNYETISKHKKDVDQDKDGEDVPKLESVKVVLLHCNLVNNNHQQAPKVLFLFVSNKQFWQLTNISPHSLIMLSTTNTEFSSIKVWFTDQNSESLEIEDNVDLTLIIG